MNKRQLFVFTVVLAMPIISSGCGADIAQIILSYKKLQNYIMQHSLKQPSKGGVYGQNALPKQSGGVTITNKQTEVRVKKAILVSSMYTQAYMQKAAEECTVQGQKEMIAALKDLNTSFMRSAQSSKNDEDFKKSLERNLAAAQPRLNAILLKYKK
ncbi:hypothetical protein Emin_1244 [Elusimicrobium minutum Pei191]|uniref:Lipoprotein n=1 Tax=Elusimicrobium minutum (strain Pei191) TaxID=445932 RepID=B2KE48_ELUMP|nr:hypothetical protein [Elusimicrobium minutum]ACC98794.1 hypothetical protein Emin_1244 [Elusimicrobium minutum Pei191]